MAHRLQFRATAVTATLAAMLAVGCADPGSETLSSSQPGPSKVGSVKVQPDRYTKPTPETPTEPEVATVTGPGSASEDRRPVETSLKTTPQTTVEPDPANPPPVSYKEAEAAFRKGRYTEAAELFTAYTESHPKNPWGYFMLGLSAWKGGHLDLAQGAFEQALELDPQHTKSFHNLARVLLEQGRPRDAQEKVKAALEIDSESNAGYRILARSHHELGEIGEALEAYRKAILLNDEDVWSMNNLGLIFIEQERFEEALAPLARATELRSDVAVFHNNLGVALERTGHFTLSAQAYRTARDLDETYHKATTSLARVESRKESPRLSPVELATLAQGFVSQIAGWGGKDPGEAPAQAGQESSTDFRVSENLPEDQC